MRKARGFALLDALLGILIFSIGILGLVGAQAMAMKAGGESQFRLEATQLATSAISALRIAQPTAIPSVVSAWRARVTGYDGLGNRIAGVDGLPGAAGTPPVIAIVGQEVTVTVFWRSGAGADLHQVTVNGTID